MLIKEIRDYAVLRYQGDSTMPQRLAILEKHRIAVMEEKLKWENNLLNLDNKITFYKNQIHKQDNKSL